MEKRRHRRVPSRGLPTFRQHTFGCHQSGSKKPATCAGFLLRGADHNLAVRLARMRGEMVISDEPQIDLHENYKEMAVANGVDEDDPALSHCR